MGTIMSNGNSAETNADRPATQKQLIQLQLEMTEKLFESTAQIQQDMSLVREDLAKIQGKFEAEEVDNVDNHSNKTETILTAGVIINFVMAIVAVLVAIHV